MYTTNQFPRWKNDVGSIVDAGVGEWKVHMRELYILGREHNMCGKLRASSTRLIGGGLWFQCKMMWNDTMLLHQILAVPRLDDTSQFSISHVWAYLFFPSSSNPLPPALSYKCHFVLPTHPRFPFNKLNFCHQCKWHTTSLNFSWSKLFLHGWNSRTPDNATLLLLLSISLDSPSHLSVLSF